MIIYYATGALLYVLIGFLVGVTASHKTGDGTMVWKFTLLWLPLFFIYILYVIIVGVFDWLMEHLF
jgi:hypothetical protein|nr:MAG TPA: hypothetical protein [Caudoviricetes sp.]